MIFNVSEMTTAVGSNALELLRKAPGVVVDRDNNLMLKGRTGVRIQINGKQSPLSVAGVKRLKEAHNENVLPLQTLAREAAVTNGVPILADLAQAFKRRRHQRHQYGPYGQNHQQLNEGEAFQSHLARFLARLGRPQTQAYFTACFRLRACYERRRFHRHRPLCHRPPKR